jgi:branched-chain amino acid transport system permease protein
MEQALVVGLVTGGIYGLYALGLVLVYRGSGVLNFAQAELGTFALFVAYEVIAVHHQPWLVGAAAAVLTALAIGLAFERLAVWPLRAAPRLSVAVGTIAMLSLLIALELTIFGANPRLLDPPIAGVGVRVLDVIVTPTQLLSLVLVALIGGALAAFLRFTDFGLSVQAAAQDQEAVRFLGIRLARVSIFTWGLAAVLSALAALLIQPTVGVISASAFGAIFIKAIGAALIGGLSSMPGAFAGGLVVGVAEAEIRHATISSSLTGLPELVIFAAVVAVLVLRPQGLLGARA